MLSAAAAATQALAADTPFAIILLAMPTMYHYQYIFIARASFATLDGLHAFDGTWTAQTGTFEGDLSRYATLWLLNSSD